MLVLLLFFVQSVNAIHGTPPPGMECLVTYEDITNDNYVEYLTEPSKTWHVAKFSSQVVKEMLATQFKAYLTQVQDSTCAAEL